MIAEETLRARRDDLVGNQLSQPPFGSDDLDVELGHDQLAASFFAFSTASSMLPTM